MALWVKKASILSPLLKSTTQQRLSVQALHTLTLSRLLPHSSSFTECPELCLLKQTGGCGRGVQRLSLEISLQPKKTSLLSEEQLTLFRLYYNYNGQPCLFIYKATRCFHFSFQITLPSGLHVNYGVCYFSLLFFLLLI